MLRDGFARESIVIPMPCPGPSDAECAASERNRNGSQRVLWIGRICEQKRPDRLLDLAEACPDVPFDLVGPSNDTEYGSHISQRAQALRNVTLHGPASRQRVAEFYRRAKLMCCTSDFEGFPNTFLEAWSWGVPIVSTVDPDNVIAEKQLGAVGKTVSDLSSGIRELLDSPARWERASLAAREYFATNHAVDKAMAQFERVFCEVVDNPHVALDGALA
jgi:glycosyltransferase involved in cell wall biosynthesis